MEDFKWSFRGGVPKILTLLTLLSALCGESLFAQSFRANKVVNLAVSTEGSSHSVKAGPNDCILIELPDDMTFVDGVELSFKFPSEIATSKGSVLWSFYEGIFPSPSAGNLDYHGTKTMSGTFGGTYSMNMKIPLKKDVPLKKDIYSYLLPSVPEITEGKILVRMQLSAKYPHEKFSYTQINVSAKPIHTNRGQLTIVPDYPAGKKNPYTVLVDGNIADDGKDLLLVPGIHTLSIVSDYYRTEQRTITIEQGKRHTLKIELQSIVPVVRISAPEGTRVYIDGAIVPNIQSPVEVTQGEHNLRLVFGNYETVKSLSVLNGRSYTISVSLDADISEENY
ncbi:MAG: PEGA domain-containing protein [Treponema sp.]|nr:PEGA domain-containing protein [Treponema sp.]